MSPNSVPVGAWLHQLSPEQQQKEQQEQVSGHAGEVLCSRRFYLIVLWGVDEEHGLVSVGDNEARASLAHVFSTHATSRAADIIACEERFVFEPLGTKKNKSIV